MPSCRTRRRWLPVLLCLSLLLAACGSTSGSPPGAEDAGPPGAEDVSAAASAEAAAAPTEVVSGDTGDPNIISVWSYLDPADPSVKAYIERFQEQNPGITVKYTAYPEDDYQDKVNAALAAQSPPDIAIIENRAWMKAGAVEELSDELKAWGVDVADYNSGGMARTAPEGNIADGVYAIGDFLGGNVLFYNKALFDRAGLPYPAVDRSLTWKEYDQICRALGVPDPDPTKTVYGCSVPFWAFDIWSVWTWGEDGHQAIGNMNSPQMVEAWDIGTKLVRERFAPSASLLQTFPAGESDMFALGKLGITWSDFTEAAKYEAQGIDFGLAPFMVHEGSPSFVDTWTAPWGTFTQSQRKEPALKFLQFIATEAQRIRVETSSDPPLATSIAQELAYGKDDPIKQQYFQVLQQAKPQVFVPGDLFPDGIWDREELYRKLTTGETTDVKALLDAEAEKAQTALDKAWQDWEKLAPN